MPPPRESRALLPTASGVRDPSGRSLVRRARPRRSSGRHHARLHVQLRCRDLCDRLLGGSPSAQLAAVREHVLRGGLAGPRRAAPRAGARRVSRILGPGFEFHAARSRSRSPLEPPRLQFRRNDQPRRARRAHPRPRRRCRASRPSDRPRPLPSPMPIAISPPCATTTSGNSRARPSPTSRRPVAGRAYPARRARSRFGPARRSRLGPPRRQRSLDQVLAGIAQHAAPGSSPHPPRPAPERIDQRPMLLARLQPSGLRRREAGGNGLDEPAMTGRHRLRLRVIVTAVADRVEEGGSAPPNSGSGPPSPRRHSRAARLRAWRARFGCGGGRTSGSDGAR